MPGRGEQALTYDDARNLLTDGANAVAELDGTTIAATLFTGLGVDQVFARTQGADTRWMLADALGSTVFLTDGAGVDRTRYAYTPHGGTTTDGESTGNARGFTGREHDEATGLYHYRARYYDPETGRFISQDPLGFGGGDVNLYAYVHNSPTNYTDPSGQTPLVLAGLIQAAVYSFAGRKTSWGGLFKNFLLGAGLTGLTLGALRLLKGARLGAGITVPRAAGSGGAGRTFTHFTDEAGATGIAGVRPLSVGESTQVGQLNFGKGQNSFLIGEGRIGVADLGIDATPGQLERIGVFGSRQQYAIQFSELDAFNSGVRVMGDLPSRNTYSIPGGCTITGVCTVTRVR